jgi:hypothetical protein
MEQNAVESERSGAPGLSRKRLLSVGVIMLVLGFGGSAVFHTSRNELSYDCGMFGVMCPEGKCIYQLIVNVGNTGLRTLDEVDISLSNEALDRAMYGPSAKNSGVIPRQVTMKKDESRAILALGALERGKRVTITTTFQRDSNETPLRCEDFLRDVHIPQGRVVKDDPAVLSFKRFLFRTFDLFMPF